MGVVTTIVVIISITITYLLIHFPNFHGTALAIRENETLSGGRQSVIDMLLSSQEEEIEESVEEVEVVEDELRGHQIRLKLPTHVTSQAVSIEQDFVYKTVTITIDGIGSSYFDDYPMIGKSNNIAEVTYESENMVGVIEIALDDVLEVQMTSEDEYVYFDFVNPSDIYDYVVVVDAGHGGKVPGASKMGVNEKDIDLAVVLELKKLFESTDKNIGVYYTRTTDVNPAFANRVGLANDSEADLFLSVHANSTASGRMSSISGTEVMYCGADASGESKAFATTCLNHLLDELGTKSKGTVVGDDIYIIRESNAPVALVEVGFMTNQEELDNMCDSNYQKKAAKALYDAVIEYLYEE